MRTMHAEYQLDDDRAQDQFIARSWVARVVVLEPKRSARRCRARVCELLACCGAYLGDEQVGVLRVISDKATFAYLADVWVGEPHRKRGIAKAMLRFAIEHPEYQGLRRWLLATKDAHEVYASIEFEPLPMPERWMIFRPAPPAPSPSGRGLG